jgi:hypothetical protein
MRLQRRPSFDLGWHLGPSTDSDRSQQGRAKRASRTIPIFSLPGGVPRRSEVLRSAQDSCIVRTQLFERRRSSRRRRSTVVSAAEPDREGCQRDRAWSEVDAGGCRRGGRAVVWVHSIVRDPKSLRARSTTKGQGHPSGEEVQQEAVLGGSAVSVPPELLPFVRALSRLLLADLDKNDTGSR